MAKRAVIDTGQLRGIVHVLGNISLIGLGLGLGLELGLGYGLGLGLVRVRIRIRIRIRVRVRVKVRGLFQSCFSFSPEYLARSESNL